MGGSPPTVVPTYVGRPPIILISKINWKLYRLQVATRDLHMKDPKVNQYCCVYVPAMQVL